jgi:hypothetical protein
MSMASNSPGAEIFESGTLGLTGITKAQLLNGDVLGTNVNPDVFVGVRFQITTPAVTSKIGGHFVGGFDSEPFFGAIVSLTDGSDFPDSSDFSTPDRIGQALLNFPHPSDEVYADLVVTLDPGWYALVVGSGALGANGTGGAVRTGSDINSPSYISWQTGSTGWFNLADLSEFHVFNNHRFVVDGQFIPEPSSLAIAILTFGVMRPRSRRYCSTVASDGRNSVPAG